MSASNDKDKLKVIFLKLKTILFSKDVLSFLIFLVLSTAFWFVHTLDRERQNTVKLKINYTGIPEDVEIKNKLPKEISVTIRDDGMKLLQYSNSSSIPLNIDLTRVFFSSGEIIITSDQLKSKIANYFLPTTAVLNITPDSLVIKYQKQTVKNLPIKVSGKIQLEKQYMLSDSIQIEPSTVKVFGPKHILDTMKAVYTENLEMKNIADTIQIQSKLKKINEIKYSFNDVNIGLFVEMFTEKKENIQINIINYPQNLQVRTFPTAVNITYNVGLSNYKKLNINDIKVIFDYRNVANTNKRKNRLQVINNSPYVSNLRIEPDEVEFLLEKK